ncbi:tyrosyl-DNA phosphodiesterase 2-like isoform X4 [Centroberyx affinis]|uniref:tyrosyl-DNA phosphodiesterase 2-like isoform X4 n=1 Tax=Centroberyx affinis TaxID=166261 RepID=UPI003A5BCBA8
MAALQGRHKQTALNSFFEADMERVFDVKESPEGETSPDAKTKKIEGDAPGDCIDLTQDSPASSSKGNTAETKRKPSEKEDSKLSLITWNVDGLDIEELPERARGLWSYLDSYTPDVVFLQELIPPYVKFLKKRAVSYTLIEGGDKGYFTGMMLKKSRVNLLQSEIVTYPTTQMMRNLLVAQVAKVGLPSGVGDVWERLGKREHCCYTWDTKYNDNKTVSFLARCRFDRIYFRPAAREGVPRLAPDNMALLGLERRDCGRYTSDHWGIYCTFSAG